MDAYTSVSLSSGNWNHVLNHLRERADWLDGQLADAPDGRDRSVVFIEREELRGVIEQIEDQLR